MVQRKTSTQRRSVRTGAANRTPNRVANRAANRTAGRPFALAIGAGGIALVLVALFFLLPALAGTGQAPETADEPDASEGAQARYPGVSFVAVGDNLPDEFIGAYADSLAGDEDDGTYDYAPIFAAVKPYIQAADIAYIDQETHLGGNDIGPSGYPAFNTTDEMATAVVDAGFDFVASATNHSYDWGYFGALNHSLSVWENMPVAFTGTAVTEEQYNRIVTIERDGITFALLNYTYGVNGYKKEDLPAYAVNFISKNRITSDVARAREEGADVVLVAMHWGTENLTEADEKQQKWAHVLADLDIDLVIGSHPHVIGPLEWVENSNGSGHRTLVAYSLGNFLADHEEPYTENVLEGMLSCNFVRDGESGEIRIENIKWTPLICHSNKDRDVFAVYAVDDYPEDLAKKNRVFTKAKDPIGWIWDTTKSIVGPQWFD